VPEILLSGDHKKIDQWRQTEGERLSRLRREG
jgi:tRNA G37 N-methylase TrmD